MMKFFQDSLSQMREVFLSLPMAQRVIASLLVGAIALCLGLLVRGGAGSQPSEYLFGGRMLSDDELLRAEAALSLAGLRDYQRVGQRLSVPVANKDAYLRALTETDALPLELDSATERALAQASPFEASGQRLSREAHAKKRDVARRIMQFHDVRLAEVDYSERREGFSSRVRQSASVSVTPLGTDPLNPYRLKQIRELVRNSWVGLKDEDVGVFDTNARGEGWDEDATPEFKAKRRWEEYYQQRARHMLTGFGPIQVLASVELDPTMGVERTRLDFQPEPLTLREQSEQRTSETTRPVSSGVPGTTTNAISNRPANLEGGEQISRKTQSSEQTDRVASQEYRTSRDAGLQVKRVSFSIGLPDSYYETLWKQEYRGANPGTSPAEIPPLSLADRARLTKETEDRIQEAVLPLTLSMEAGDDRFPLVKVWNWQDLPEPAPEVISTGQLALGWLAQSWQTVALIAVTILALLIARSIARSIPPAPREEFSEGFGLEIPVPASSGEEGEEGEEGARPGMTITGKNLQIELTELIDSNPEAAANVLRAWIGEAA